MKRATTVFSTLLLATSLMVSEAHSEEAGALRLEGTSVESEPSDEPEAHPLSLEGGERAESEPWDGSGEEAARELFERGLEAARGGERRLP